MEQYGQSVCLHFPHVYVRRNLFVGMRTDLLLGEPRELVKKLELLLQLQCSSNFLKERTSNIFHLSLSGLEFGSL